MKFKLENSHPFYEKTEKEKKAIQLKVIAIALLLFIPSLLVAWQTKIFFIAIFVFYLLITIIAPFIDVPTNQKNWKIDLLF